MYNVDLQGSIYIHEFTNAYKISTIPNKNIRGYYSKTSFAHSR